MPERMVERPPECGEFVKIRVIDERLWAYPLYRHRSGGWVVMLANSHTAMREYHVGARVIVPATAILLWADRHPDHKLDIPF